VITTASTTQRCKSALERWLAGSLARALACAMLAVTVLGVRADTAEITQLRFDRTDEGLLLSANINFDLPPAVDDALAKGIPMFFVAEASLLRDRWYWTDKHVASATRHMRLSYQPLTRRWRLVISSGPIGNSGLALGQNFDTRDEALAAIQRISHWKIAEPGDIDPESRYSVDFRFRLDVSQLPRPFQIGAVGHSDWSISASRNVRLVFEPNPR
jgi:hypothetical protein